MEVRAGICPERKGSPHMRLWNWFSVAPVVRVDGLVRLVLMACALMRRMSVRVASLTEVGSSTRDARGRSMLARNGPLHRERAARLKMGTRTV